MRPQTIVAGLKSIHAYGGRKPKECLSAMSFAFQSEEFTARYHIPSYAKWLESSDMTPAYRMHRLVLQILQRRWSATRWVLKSPVHLHSLPVLLATYPDARVAVTHRDPIALLGSLTSLIANLRWAHSDHVDSAEIARGHHQRYRASFDALVDGVDAGRWPEAQFHHSLFEDFVDAPLDVVRGLYSHFGIPLGDREADAMRIALAENPRDAQGRHEYAAHDAGDSKADPRRDFRRYQKCFGVADAR